MAVPTENQVSAGCYSWAEIDFCSGTAFPTVPSLESSAGLRAWLSHSEFTGREKDGGYCNSSPATREGGAQERLGHRAWGEGHLASSWLRPPDSDSPSQLRYHLDSHPWSAPSYARGPTSAADINTTHVHPHFLGTGYKLSTVQETTPHRHSLC